MFDTRDTFIDATRKLQRIKREYMAGDSEAVASDDNDDDDMDYPEDEDTDGTD